MGTMHFLDGSHHGEIYGRIFETEDSKAMFEQFPTLPEIFAEVASPIFEPGDATFHHCQVIHGAPANSSDRVRWSYITGFMAGDCRYTGASCVHTHGLDLQLDAPVRHANFPEIWPAAA
jgi:ectoine hydroxylase-related dioxygenase (phytanoyl-CoA dioxygenase family)